MKVLVVGDVHATVAELDDCSALGGLILSSVDQYDIHCVIFLGDQYHTHDVVSVRVIEYWRSLFKELSKRLAPRGGAVIALVGNHDRSVVTNVHPHAMLIHEDVVVVDKPLTLDYLPGVDFVPYYHSPQDFLDVTKDMTGHTLVCHQTFDGAQYDNGFYAENAVKDTDVPHKIVISGHIHTSHSFGKVVYPGSPRWRTLSDVGADKYVYVYDFGRETSTLITAIPTDTHCRRIALHKDYPGSDVASPYPGKNIDLRVDIYGPTPEYVRQRESAWKALGARTRGFPEREKKTSVSESMAPDVAFGVYVDSLSGLDFTSDFLKGEVAKRLDQDCDVEF